MSKGTIIKELTLQVNNNRQHDTSLQSVQPNHLDYISIAQIKEQRIEKLQSSLVQQVFQVG